MSVFRIPFCTHEITISQSYALGNLNPPSKAGGLRLTFFQSVSYILIKIQQYWN